MSSADNKPSPLYVLRDEFCVSCLSTQLEATGDMSQGNSLRDVTETMVRIFERLEHNEHVTPMEALNAVFIVD